MLPRSLEKAYSSCLDGPHGLSARSSSHLIPIAERSSSSEASPLSLVFRGVCQRTCLLMHILDEFNDWTEAGMFSFGKSECLRLSFAGVVFLAIAFSCTAQTSRVAGAVQGSIVDQ